MKNILVALDIETTGLDSQNDRIIEIGAVQFSDSKILEEFNSLINPGIRIPPFISQLTGITDAMVRSAPPIEEVLDQLVDFVNDAPVVGHNVNFDLSFLKKQGVLKQNQAIDTYEMASVVLPAEGRYNLRALGQSLSVPMKATHRALDDTRVTQAIYHLMYQIILEQPLSLLAELVRLGKSTNWDGYLPFLWAYQEKLANNGSSEVTEYQNPLLLNPPLEEKDPLQPNTLIKGLDLEEVSSILQPGGPFHKSFPEYEHRAEQIEMIRAASRAISEGRHYLIEAGTGIGKSLAYLIPSALWAVKNQQRVVISTNTINLQDQLISKDIPLLLDTLDLKCKATVLKGRSNYLCPHHLESLRKTKPKTADEMRVLGKILVWLESSLSGDRGEINLNGPRERRIWNRVSAEHEDCSTEGCLKRTGGRCPFYRARQDAHSSHLIVVNHALLLADVATGNRVLPEYDTLVIDEAHHLESATTNALSFYTSQTNLRRSLNALGDEKKGILNWILTLGQNTLSPSDYGAIHQLTQSIIDRSFKTESRMDEVFRIINTFLERKRGGKPVGRYTQQVRIQNSTRLQPDWEEIEAAWDQARQSLHGLLEDIQKLWEGINEVLQADKSDDKQYETILNDLREASRELFETYENIDDLVFEPDPNMIYWVESPPHRPAVAIQAAPLHIGDLMERYIWFEKRSVILTSATLTTAGNFEYIRSRLQADDAEELALGSPFDYQNAALLYLVDDVPEPSDIQGHQLHINRGLIDLCKATGGRTLVLFTSYSQLQKTSEAITGPLSQEGIIVYEQGSGPSPHTLLKSFRQAEQAVLLGTRAFWEGVDIPGQDLSVLVIAKLPFQVPSDPIVAARAETYAESFQEFMLPEAILSFRQGFGRLIRSKQDVGVVVVFDNRLLNKSYGSLFLSSLTDCTIQTGPLSDLPKTASRWLNI
ncbi:MAG: 3'-5' exoribonuclease [Anaerolineales bacterium]|nr:3'-5' exoribonuclease [Anaerolineales bacterium]